MHVLSQELAVLWRSRSLAWVLARRDITSRSAATAGGILWAYAQPLLMLAAYYLLFDVIFGMRMGGETGRPRPAGQFLIVGALPWMAFCDAVARGTSSLLDAGNLLHKNALPAVLFPVRTVMASSIVYLPLMIVVTLAYGLSHGFSGAYVAVLPLLAFQLMLCTVLAYLLAVMAAALRDTVQIAGFALSVGIFASPILFPMALFPQDWRWALWINPMTPFVLGYQDILLDGRWPSWPTWVSACIWILASAWLLDKVVHRSCEELVDWL